MQVPIEQTNTWPNVISGVIPKPGSRLDEQGSTNAESAAAEFPVNAGPEPETGGDALNGAGADGVTSLAEHPAPAADSPVPDLPVEGHRREEVDAVY
jgi:hypothetical protein